MTNVSIILPCMNEEDGIEILRSRLFPVVEELRKSRTVELILVDDGSTDQTLTGLKNLAASFPGTRVLNHERNRGLGAAIRTGMKEAKGDVLVTTDFDGTYGFHEIPRLLELLQPGIDAVVASPYHPGGGIEGVPPYRLVLSRGASTLYRILVSSKVHTYTGLFRAYRREAITGIDWVSDGYLSMAEILVRLLQAGKTVAEYPTVLRARTYGESKAKTMRIIRQHLGFLAAVAGKKVGVRSRYFR